MTASPTDLPIRAIRGMTGRLHRYVRLCETFPRKRFVKRFTRRLRGKATSHVILAVRRYAAYPDTARRQAARIFMQIRPADTVPAPGYLVFAFRKRIAGFHAQP